MTQRGDIGANLEALNADTKQFTDAATNALEGDAEKTLLADYARAQELAQELAGVLGKVLVSGDAYVQGLKPFDEDGDAYKDLVDRADNLCEDSDGLSGLNHSMRFVNIGIPEIVTRTVLDKRRMQDGIEAAHRIEQTVKQHATLLEVLTGKAKEDIRNTGDKVDEIITGWQERS